MKLASILAALAATAATAFTAPASPATAADPTASESTAATLTVRSTRYGRALFDGSGRVLYAFSSDRRGSPSRCYGECAAAWPVYFAKGTLRAGAGVKQSLIRTTRRRDGRLQVTYNGWPLYYYAHEGRGEVKCHNVTIHGGTWRVVGPGGNPVR